MGRRQEWPATFNSISTTIRFLLAFSPRTPTYPARIAKGSSLPVEAGKGFIVSRHRFKVGQTVHLMPNRLERHVPGGAYTIQRALPDEGRDLQYRVKNVQDGHERVVSEAQLRPAEALTPHH